MINRRKRRDGNHAEVLDAFKRCGWSIIDTSQLGDNIPDAVVARGSRVVLVEIKTAKGKLKPGQSSWLAAWPGETAIVRSAADVAAITVGDIGLFNGLTGAEALALVAGKK